VLAYLAFLAGARVRQVALLQGIEDNLTYAEKIEYRMFAGGLFGVEKVKT